MDGAFIAGGLCADQHFLDNILNDFTEADAGFRPKPEMLSVAEQIAHIALTIDWFVDGAFHDRWDADFEAGERKVREPRTLAQARELLAAAFQRASETAAPMTAEQLAAPMADNMFLGALPRASFLHACIGHTSHHRGALSVYLRLLGKTPKMVYA